MRQDVFGGHFLKADLVSKELSVMVERSQSSGLLLQLIVNADGEKETPIVIWKPEKPRCFKGINVSSLPVHYYNQSKAWMTGEILDKVLTKLNRKFSSQHRNVALLLDNAGCHPDDLKGKYSNIKLLPPNTTSKLQPLDVGIIQTLRSTIELSYCATYCLKLTKPHPQPLKFQSL